MEAEKTLLWRPYRGTKIAFFGPVQLLDSKFSNAFFSVTRFWTWIESSGVSLKISAARPPQAARAAPGETLGPASPPPSLKPAGDDWRNRQHPDLEFGMVCLIIYKAK